MTQDEIILCADASGISIFAMGMDRKEFLRRLDAFTKLVAAKEREANIKIIKETPFSNWFQADVIEAIRARGEQA